MRLFLTTLLTLLSFLTVAAQENDAGYVDVVHLYARNARVGSVITYEYGKRVILLDEDGRMSEFSWDQVKRVNFRLDKSRVSRAQILAGSRSEEQPVTALPQDVVAPPDRRFWHQVDAGFSMGVSLNDRFGSRTTIGGGVSYHYVRELGRLRAGLGADLGLMSYLRQENVVAGTGLVEWPLGRGLKKMRTFVRFQGGITFPFGGLNSDDEVSARRLTPLYHPSFGLEFGPPAGGWGTLVIDVGYRFLNSRFDLTTATLDVVQRSIVYRRLVIRGGYRF